MKVNAKLVTRIDVPSGASKDEVLARAYADATVKACLEDSRVTREIYVENQLINLVTQIEGGPTR